MKKREDGRYMINIPIGYTPEGKPKYKSIYGKTQQEVKLKAEKFNRETEHGLYLPNDITFEDFSLQWFKVYKQTQSYNTKEMYRQKIDKYINPAIGKIKLSDLKKMHIQSLINDICAKGSLRTAEMCLLTIKQILNQAVDSDIIKKNCASSIKLPKNKTSNKRAITADEEHTLLNAPLTVKERVFVLLLLRCGLRRGEALALTLSDFTDTTVTVNKTLIFKESESEITPPKTKASNRTIPIPKEVSQALSQYKHSLTSVYLFPQAKDSSKLQTRSSYAKFWRSIKNKASDFGYLGDDVTAHILRHSYCSMLIKAGVNIKTMQYLLGHSSIQMTMDVYTHLCDDQISESALQIEKYLSVAK